MDAAARVLHGKAEPLRLPARRAGCRLRRPRLPTAGSFRNLEAQGHPPAGAGELERVAHEVVDDLPQAQDVPLQQRRHVFGHLRAVGYPPLARLRGEVGVLRRHERPHVEGAQGKPQLAAFHLAHVQHVVHQREQVAGRCLHLVQARAHLLVVAEAALRDGRHAHDAVQGRAYLMGHAREEFAFRRARVAGARQGLFGAAALVGEAPLAAGRHAVERHEDRADDGRQHRRGHQAPHGGIDRKGRLRLHLGRSGPPACGNGRHGAAACGHLLPHGRPRAFGLRRGGPGGEVRRQKHDHRKKGGGQARHRNGKGKGAPVRCSMRFQPVRHLLGHVVPANSTAAAHAAT